MGRMKDLAIDMDEMLMKGYSIKEVAEKMAMEYCDGAPIDIEYMLEQAAWGMQYLLEKEVRDMLEKGSTDTEIVTEMVRKYKKNVTPEDVEFTIGQASGTDAKR